MKVFCVAIDSIKCSSKLEISSRFFGCLKIFVLFEFLSLVNETLEMLSQAVLDMLVKFRWRAEQPCKDAAS